MTTNRETWVRVRVTDDERDAFAAFAAKEGTTMSTLIRQYMAEAQVQSPQTEWE